MQPAEALTRVLTRAINHSDGTYEDGRSTALEYEQEQIAISVVQAILNTALPIARFRAFVRIESGPNEGSEFTVCAVKMTEIVSCLMPLTLRPVKVYISLWEQRPTGADMLAGYQGLSRKSIGKPAGMVGYLNQLLAQYPHAS